MQKTQKTQKRHMTAALLALALALLLGTASPALAASAFSDVPDSHWASSYIRTAYEKGWIDGMGGGKYAPSDTLTRAQFLKMVAGAFFPEDLAEAAVPGESPWYASSWTVAQAYDLQSGTSMSKLSDLTAKISRYDMAQIIMNAMTSKGIFVFGADYSKDIEDWSSIPKNYQEAVTFAYAAGVLNGKNGKFAGQDTMTRAEAAAVLCRMDSEINPMGTMVPPAEQTPSTQTPSTQAPATQKPTTTESTPEEFAAEVIRLVNEERAKVGASALGTYDSLTKAAQIRAPELITKFEHTRPDGSTCFTALDETGAKTGAYTYGENIAAGQSTPAAVVESWMNSPGHKANILNKDFTHIGVGYVKGGSYGHYWVQMFTGVKGTPGGGTTTTTQTPAATPTTQTPTTQTPTTQTPATQTPTTQTPTTQTPTTQTPTTQTPTQTPEELAAEVVRLVNEERAKAGAAPLGTYDSLTKAAQIRAPELVTLFSHTRPDGSECFTTLDETGADKNTYLVGENIAAGCTTAADVMEMWMNSPGHRSNILNKDFTHIGVACVKSGYWVQMFTSVKGVPGGSTTTAQTPSTQTPAAQTPTTQAPTTQTPGTQTPGTQTPGTQTPNTSAWDDERRTSTYLAKKFALSCLSLNMKPTSYGTTEVYVYSTSDFYGKDFTTTWSVDNPGLLTLEEMTSKGGNPAVRFYGTGVTGQARITCTITTADGMTATQFCDVTVMDR